MTYIVIGIDVMYNIVKEYNRGRRVYGKGKSQQSDVIMAKYIDKNCKFRCEQCMKETS